MKIIKFKIPNKYGYFLNDILKDMNTKNFKWFLDYEEIHASNGKEWLFDNDKYSDEEFRKLISSEEYYIIFAKIPGKLNEESVKNEIFIDIVDSSIVEIHIFDKMYLKTLNNNAIKNNFKNIEIID